MTAELCVIYICVSLLINVYFIFSLVPWYRNSRMINLYFFKKKAIVNNILINKVYIYAPTSNLFTKSMNKLLVYTDS